MEIQKEFDAIFWHWNKGASHSDIYHLIVLWLSKHFKDIKTIEEKHELYQRTEYGELKEIVEDFIYGDQYRNLRKEFGRN